MSRRGIVIPALLVFVALLVSALVLALFMAAIPSSAYIENKTNQSFEIRYEAVGNQWIYETSDKTFVLDPDKSIELGFHVNDHVQLYDIDGSSAIDSLVLFSQQMIQIQETSPQVFELVVLR